MFGQVFYPADPFACCRGITHGGKINKSNKAPSAVNPVNAGFYVDSTVDQQVTGWALSLVIKHFFELIERHPLCICADDFPGLAAEFYGLFERVNPDAAYA